MNAPHSLWRASSPLGAYAHHAGNGGIARAIGVGGVKTYSCRCSSLRHRPTDVQNFELIGCTKAEDADGYRCDTRGQVTLEIAGRQVPVPVSKNLRYAKADGTWRAYAK
ncbi:hypothetical protein GUF72_03715 [Xanthomonas citri pv. citri]|uniref:Uncharacterized protein n=1 Tax=Xanthomonas citri pv. citri TaxID=611301 RepID=A0A8I0L634_XANCI|nr:hypothetical protein [Xanthomonas citri]QOX05199.1 hypothetical protein IG630_16780 [Xanthomonas sp. WG16]APR10008.1 hypothetical protein BI314_07265 [Xanthomonas citri pv. citri]APR14746.1 hypothetical protein BI315_07630 [Xanthomonas citri pv. citri]APR21297.1 hypothetical protein BI316_19015 [Xanthomonas citri pv. citri]APR26478.1 hypothetical protein BJD09_22255 [Xanthomonas citri pv. citri]